MSRHATKRKNLQFVRDREQRIRDRVGELLNFPSGFSISLDTITPQASFYQFVPDSRWLSGPTVELQKADVTGDEEQVARHLAQVLQPHAERLLAELLGEALS